jgi:hypothetical protein
VRQLLTPPPACTRPPAQIPAARGKPAYTLQQLAEWDLPGDDFAAAAPFPAPGLARADTIGPRLELGSLANHSLELTSLATHKNTYSSLVKPASSSSSLSSPPPARRYEVYGIGPAPALAVLVARYWVTDAEDAAPVTPEAAARAAAGVADSLARLTAQAASKRAVFSSQALVGVADGRGGWAAVGWGCGPRPGAAARYARQRRQWKAAVAVGGTTQAASTAAAGVAARSLLALPSPPPCAAASPGQASSALSSPPSCAAYASSAEEMTPVTSEGVHWRGNPAAPAAASAPLAAGAAVLLLPAADLAQLSLRPAKRSASYEARDSSSHDDGKVAAFSCWGGLRKRSAGAGRRLLGRLRLGGRSVSPV